MSDSAIPWTTARQASLSITNSQRLLKLMSIESVTPSNHLILCCSLLLLPSIFPSISSFQMSQFFISGGQSIGVSASILSAWCLNQIISVHNTGITRDIMSNSSPGIMNPVGHHFSPLGFPKHLQTNNILIL